MIVLIHRTYLFIHSRTPRALTALTVAAVVAGCGSSGGGSTQPSGGATPTPTPSIVGVSVGAGNSGRAAGKIAHGGVGTVVRQRAGGITHSAAGSVSRGQAGTVLSKQAAQQQQQK